MPAQRIDVRHALFTGVLCLPTALASPATICAILPAACWLLPETVESGDPGLSSHALTPPYA